jgi:hypothetical protein
VRGVQKKITNSKKKIVEKMTVNPVFLAMQKICSTKRATYCSEKPNQLQNS